MNYLDIILAIPLLWTLFKGFSKGFIIEVASLLAIILGVYGGIHFSYFVTDALHLTSSYSSLISFAITFILIVVIVYLLAKILEKSINLLALGLLNKLAGAFFALLKMSFILSVLLMFFNKIDAKAGLIPDDTKKHSLLYSPVSAFAPLLIPRLNFDEIKKTAGINK